MGNGLGAARSLKKRRKHDKMLKWAKKVHVRGLMFMGDPLEGAPMARGLVLEKREVEPRKPNSARRKCVRVQLIKNGVQLTAYCPGDGAIKKIDEHDEVTVTRTGGSQNGPMGDMPGIRFKVIKVNGIALTAILSGKKEKARR